MDEIRFNGPKVPEKFRKKIQAIQKVCNLYEKNMVKTNQNIKPFFKNVI